MPQHFYSKLASAAVFAIAAASAGLAQAAAPVKTVDGLLVSTNGMTLYTFDNDVAGSGKSACNGPCAGLWPPVMADADAKPEGDMTIITRDDGAKQWAYKGKPVYLYKTDAKAGDKTGDNFKNVWHVIKP
ncbi:MAG: hypothetical protein KKC85_13605 [Gammaproteobacteria bacterium]|nr:hypothetical protein [Gammaproteobacteria bacterium]MBU1439773.1 hypothetical protein [Gammaproteobacteria bacterium]MBU2287458.1 hypothetical protein [Gammaproteobacteria bacterium]